MYLNVCVDEKRWASTCWASYGYKGCCLCWVIGLRPPGYHKWPWHSPNVVLQCSLNMTASVLLITTGWNLLVGSEESEMHNLYNSWSPSTLKVAEPFPMYIFLQFVRNSFSLKAPWRKGKKNCTFFSTISSKFDNLFCKVPSMQGKTANLYLFMIPTRIMEYQKGLVVT